MQASFDHAHKPATCQESVAFSRNAEAAAAEAAEAYPRIHVSAGGQVVAAGRVDAASDGRVLELVRQAGQHGVDVVDHDVPLVSLLVVHECLPVPPTCDASLCAEV